MIFMTGSRLGFLVFLFNANIFAILKMKKFSQFLYFITFLILILNGQKLLNFINIGRFNEIITLTAWQNIYSLVSRIETWNEAWITWNKSFLLGPGVQLILPHNSFLTFGSLFGFIGYCSGLVYLIVLLWGDNKHAFSLNIILMYTTLVLFALTGEYLFIPSIIFIFITYVCLLMNERKYSNLTS